MKSGGEAILTGSGGDLMSIAVTGDLIGSFTFAPKINSAGTVAFGADLTVGGRALFTGSGGELTRIADTMTGPFSGFLGVTANINGAGTVVFGAMLTSGGAGIFTGRGGPPSMDETGNAVR